MPQETETTGLSAQDIAALKAAYGTNIDADTWNSILQSNPGITEAMLTQAGFTKSGGTTGGGNISGVTDYDSAIAYMKAAGVDGGVRSGLMTKSEWSRRKASLQQYGTRRHRGKELQQLRGLHQRLLRIRRQQVRRTRYGILF